MAEKIFLMLWLADVAEGILLVCGVGLIPLGIGALMAGVHAVMGNDKEKVIGRKFAKVLVPAFFISMALAVAVPSKRTIHTYTALAVGLDVAEMAGLNETAKKGLLLLDKRLDAALAEEGVTNEGK